MAVRVAHKAYVLDGRKCTVDDGDSRCCSLACEKLIRAWVPTEAFCERSPERKLESPRQDTFFRAPDCTKLFGG